METQNTDTKRPKADILLKIELPNQEKPFYNKMATENNMIVQIKKAGTKLGENENLNVSFNDKEISLSKFETQSPTLRKDVQEKLNTNSEKNDQHENVSKSLAQGSIKEYEGEYNGVFQKLWIAKDTKDNFYTTDSLEFAEEKGAKLVDADLTKWKSISNESFSRIDDEMHLKRVVNNQIIGEVSPLKQTATTTNANDLEIKDYSVQSQDGNKKNLEYLKDQIKYLGFGEDANLHKHLKNMVENDVKEFSITTTSDKTSFQNKVSFDLHFSRSKDTNNVFFNKFDATLTNEKNNTNLQHTFAVKNNGFTAKQAINLLEGRSVKTEITKPNSAEKEIAFVKLKLNEEKNENGNFKLQVYNKNYGVDTEKIIDKSNLVFKDDKHREITIKSLEKGNIVAVKMKENGKESEGKAVLNPQYKMLNLYDNNMKRLNSNAPFLAEAQSVDKEVKKQHHLSR